MTTHIPRVYTSWPRSICEVFSDYTTHIRGGYFGVTRGAGPRPAPIALWRAKLTRRDGPMTIPCHGTAQKSPFVNPFADAYLPLTLAFSADHVIVTASEAN